MHILGWIEEQAKLHFTRSRYRKYIILYKNQFDHIIDLCIFAESYNNMWIDLTQT